MLGGLMDYSGLYAGLPLPAEPPAAKPPKSPPSSVPAPAPAPAHAHTTAAAAAAAAAASAFRPLRQPWLPDTEAEVRGQVMLQAEVRARASLEAQLRGREVQETEDGERKRSLEEDCRVAADTTQVGRAGTIGTGRTKYEQGSVENAGFLLE